MSTRTHAAVLGIPVRPLFGPVQENGMAQAHGPVESFILRW